MATIYKFRVWCNTEQKFVEGWLEQTPTVCFNNCDHSIDTDKTSIIESKEDNTVSAFIKEEDIPTGGHFQCTTQHIQIPNTIGWHETTKSWPYPISMLAAQYIVSEANFGDEIEFSVGPKTVIGLIAKDIYAGENQIYVSSTVIQNAFVGCWICMCDGVNQFDFGRVLAIDEDSQTLTMENAAEGQAQGSSSSSSSSPQTSSSSSGGQPLFYASTPTYVRMTVKMAFDFTLGAPGRYILGDSKIGGSYIPKDTIMLFRYYNKEAEAKVFDVIIEYLY